jgi:HAD superfamily hydrolase (TIGR01509 family)
MSGSPANEAGRAARAADTALWMFDFDNTLAPLEPAVDWAASRRELQAWLAERGVAPALFEEFPRGNLVLYEALRARLEAGGAAARSVLPSSDAAAAAYDRHSHGALLRGASAIIERYELAGVGALAPAPGALELLRALNAAGCAVAVVTSNSSRTIRAWLTSHRAEALARVIVGRDSGLALKPSPATLRRALELCAVTPAEAVFVGDSEADFRAAAGSGVRFYGINARAEGRERLFALGAAEVFTSPAALAAHLDLQARETALKPLKAMS